MSKSINIGPFRVRPHKRNGQLTGRWVVDIPPSVTGGKRRRKLFDNRIDTVEYAKVLKNRGVGRHPHPSVNVPKIGPTFHEVVEKWIERETMRVRTGEKRAVSFKTDQYRLKALQEYFGSSRLESITEDDILSYKMRRIDAGRSKDTVNSDLRTLRKIARWAYKRRLIFSVPEIELVSVNLPTPVLPTPDEVIRIIQHLPDRLKLLVKFMAETGVRSGEAFNLTWENVNELQGEIAIRANDDWTPKTSHSNRDIPIDGQLMALIRETPRTSKYVFPGKQFDKPISNIRKAFAKAVAEANIRRKGITVPVTPKTLRKCYATWQAMRGVPSQVLKALMGHSPASTVMDRHYAFATDEAKRKWIVSLPDELDSTRYALNSSGNILATERVENTKF